MEFSEGLTVLSPAEASAVLAEAGRQHLPMFVLATDGRVDRETFFHVVIVWPDAVSPAPDGADEDFRTAQEVLRDITESLTDPVTTNGTPKRVSVFIAVAPGP
ncbi:hypothetical protein [Streptomyces sp. NPDC005760]|uniref:hypothetical protein n=1 Tax=Streptomyces sp. NPDC005760 TaxID=3156718 RepID=UPI0033E22AB6